MIINTFSAYVVPLLKDINHLALLQEWKLDTDAAAYERNIDANISTPSDKKYFDRHDSDLYWPITIKYTIQWFPFFVSMKHTANILKPKKGLINLLLKVFAIFELRLIYDKDKLEAIAIRYINCKKATGFFKELQHLKK